MRCWILFEPSVLTDFSWHSSPRGRTCFASLLHSGGRHAVNHPTDPWVSVVIAGRGQGVSAPAPLCGLHQRCAGDGLLSTGLCDSSDSPLGGKGCPLTAWWGWESRHPWVCTDPMLEGLHYRRARMKGPAPCLAFPGSAIRKKNGIKGMQTAMVEMKLSLFYHVFDMIVYRRHQYFSARGQIGNIFSFVGNVLSVTTTRLGYYSLKAAIGKQKQIGMFL